MDVKMMFLVTKGRGSMLSYPWTGNAISFILIILHSALANFSDRSSGVEGLPQGRNKRWTGRDSGISCTASLLAEKPDREGV